MMSEDRDFENVAKAWSIAAECSQKRLRKAHNWGDDDIRVAIQDGTLMLETVCLFVHACLRQKQFRLPIEFWRLLQHEYGIQVYPSAFTEETIFQGAISPDETFTKKYHGHIVMFGHYCGKLCPPPCPFAALMEPPPAYER